MRAGWVTGLFGWLGMAVAGWGAVCSVDLQFSVVKNWENLDDGDAVDNAWEVLWFGNLATVQPASDYDGDGFSDYSEYVAGTDPRDSGSLLSITGLRFMGDGQVQLEWSTATVDGRARSYRVYAADSVEELAAGGELLLSGFRPDFGNGLAAPVLKATDHDRRFYRVEVNLD